MASDFAPESLISDLKLAFGLMTRIPAGRSETLAAAAADPGARARASRAYPLAGLAIGVIGGAVYWLCMDLYLPPLVAALAAVAATIFATGGLHEDGLADVADGFGGGSDRARKLEIMRDSAIGSYGVLALILSVGLRAAALAAIAGPAAVFVALLAAHSVSRGLLGPVMALTPLARTSGLAAATGRPRPGHALTALLLGAVIAVMCLDLGPGLLALALAALAALVVALLARAQIGGYTGDVLGAVEQSAEIIVLLTVAALL